MNDRQEFISLYLQREDKTLEIQLECGMFLQDLVGEIELFLRGAGYIFDGKLAIIAPEDVEMHDTIDALQLDDPELWLEDEEQEL